MIEIRNSINNWYQTYKRDLPWRIDHDPYKVWLSEIIMQQTRIDQGTPYYIKFLESFPSIIHLANVSEDEVLKHWQGLGYYSRARNLHHTAKVIVEEYNAIFPAKYDEIIKLKGIGDYTASMILSICFNQALAVVDGNVSRIISRIFGITEFIDKPKGQKRIKQEAQKLLDIESPGDFNEALMDFGSMVCIPANPNCANCPVSEFCLAFKKNKQSMLPVKSPKMKVKKRYFHYFLVSNADSILMGQRTSKDIWRKLYDLPLFESKNSQLLKKEIIKNDLNSSIEEIEVSDKLKHKLTHQEIHIQFYKMKLYDPVEPINGYKWIILDDINDYAVPKPIEAFLNKHILKIH